MKIAIRFVLLILLLSFFNAQADVVKAKASDNLLSELIQKNADAWNKISSASYQIELNSELETPDGKRINHGKGLVKLKGNCRWSIFENDAQIPQKNWQQTQAPKVILNENYLGYLPSLGNAYAYRVDHNSIKTITMIEKTHLTMFSPPDYQLLNICYKEFENNSFSEQMKLFSDEIRWEAIEKRDDGNIYEIRRFSPYMHDQSKPDAIWTIDGDKGFLVTERISFTKDGNISENIKIEAKKFLPKIWFPISFNKKRFDQSGHSDMTVTLSDIQLNLPISQEQFEMAALELPKDITIFWTDTNDETTAWVYEDDKLVKKSEFLERQLTNQREEQKTLQQSLVGKKAPSLKIQDWLQGGPVTLNDLKARYIILHFFGEWCVPCRKTYPLLVNIYNSIKPEDVIIIGISVSKSKSTDVQNLLTKYDIKYTVGIDEPAKEKDYTGETFASYLVKGIPHTVLIDKNGNIVANGRVEEIIKVLEENLITTENK